jgi:hypothetical protein
MSAPYKETKPGRLVFKGGDPASLAKKKQKKKSKTKSKLLSDDPLVEGTATEPSDGTSASASQTVAGGGDVYTIDAAKKMKYEELFPVETKKFQYDPKNASRSVARTVEEALDDRVRKKADRYCK